MHGVGVGAGGRWDLYNILSITFSITFGLREFMHLWGHISMMSFLMNRKAHQCPSVKFKIRHQIKFLPTHGNETSLAFLTTCLKTDQWIDNDLFPLPSFESKVKVEEESEWFLGTILPCPIVWGWFIETPQAGGSGCPIAVHKAERTNDRIKLCLLVWGLAGAHFELPAHCLKLYTCTEPAVVRKLISKRMFIRSWKSYRKWCHGS